MHASVKRGAAVLRCRRRQICLRRPDDAEKPTPGYGAQRDRPPGGGIALVRQQRRRRDTFNLFPDLGRIWCPTLVIGGDDDVMHPIESQADLAAACRRTS